MKKKSAKKKSSKFIQEWITKKSSYSGSYIITFALLGLIVISIGLNAFQFVSLSKIKSQENSLLEQKNSLEAEVSNLKSSVVTYLDAQGEPCRDNPESCPNKITTQIKSDNEADKDCSSIRDGICPRWCAAGADYDCCVEAGSEWIPKRGCYSKEI